MLTVLLATSFALGSPPPQHTSGKWLAPPTATPNHDGDAGKLEPLRLRADGSFSIMQVADVHTGEGEASWGAATDLRTYLALDRALARPPPLLRRLILPSLAVLA